MNKITFRKRLFALAVCVFAWVGVNAQQNEPGVHDNILTITPETVTRGDWGNLSGVNTVKLVGTFNGWSEGWLINGDSNSKSNITTIDLSGAVMTSTTAGTPDGNGDVRATNKWRFQKFQNTSLEIIWPTEDNITVIPDYAFTQTGLQSVTIPGYIKTICSHAFDSDDGDGFLKSVYFAEYDKAPKDGISDVNMRIGYQAFSNTTAVVDVYVLTSGTLDASKMVFPEKITYGQGDVTRVLAHLHFPDDKKDDYVNANHPLDQATASNEGLFQKWLVDHYTKAYTSTGQPNGWYEFVSAGTNPPKNEPDWGDVVLRTFSHPTVDYVVPKGAKAYIVNSVTKSTDASGDKYTLTLKKVNVIPHGTGVILYGGTNHTYTTTEKNTSTGQDETKTKRILEMMAVDFTGSAYTQSTAGEYHNLLVSTSVNAQGEPSLAMDGIEVSPYETDNSGAVTYRNFFMGKFKKTVSGNKPENKAYNDFVGFFRAQKSTISARKAYLRLPNSEVVANTCGEIIVPADVTTTTYGNNTVRSYRVEYTSQSTEQNPQIYSEDEMKSKGYWYKTATASIEWTDDWGVRNSSLVTAKFEGEPIIEFEEMGGVATLVVPASMVEQEDADSYYTLQGVKVSNPSKGVYIKNGKKVIVK